MFWDHHSFSLLSGLLLLTSLRLRLLRLLLTQQIDSGGDCIVEHGMILAILEDLIHWQIDDHTSDLSCKWLVNLGDVGIQQVTEILLLLALIRGAV